MTKILIDEAAVKLVLEALEMYLLETNSQFQRSAVTALREALVQQALDKKAENARELGLDYEPAQQEPVALVIDGVLVKSELPEKYTGHLYTSPPAQRTWVEVEQVKWEDDKLIAKLKEKNT